MGASPVTQTTIFKKLSKARRNKLSNPVRVDLKRFQPLDQEIRQVSGDQRM